MLKLQLSKWNRVRHWDHHRCSRGCLATQRKSGLTWRSPEKGCGADAGYFDDDDDDGDNDDDDDDMGVSEHQWTWQGPGRIVRKSNQLLSC